MSGRICSFHWFDKGSIVCQSAETFLIQAPCSATNINGIKPGSKYLSSTANYHHLIPLVVSQLFQQSKELFVGFGCRSINKRNQCSIIIQQQQTVVSSNIIILNTISNGFSQFLSNILIVYLRLD